MKKSSLAYRVFDLYYDGFKNMKLGRTLWAIILIKLFIIFVVLPVFRVGTPKPPEASCPSQAPPACIALTAPHPCPERPAWSA